jgi:ERF superfamily
MPKQNNEQIERTETKLSVMDPQALIASAVEHGAGIETLERLVALAKEVRAEQAKAAYYEAMAEFQRQCPRIPKPAKARISMKSGGSFEYSYAPLDVIMEKITPVMGPLGLSISYRMLQAKDTVTAVCRINHELGHYEESGEVTMPVTLAKTAEGGYTGANPAQCVGIAASYAKRYALLAITGVAPQGDDIDGSSTQNKKITNVRPIVKHQDNPEPVEEFNLQPQDQPEENITHCHVTGVIPKRDSKKRLYMLIETDNGAFYCWDEKRFKEIALTEGQDVKIEFDPKKSGDKVYRYIKTIEIIAPEGAA